MNKTVSSLNALAGVLGMSASGASKYAERLGLPGSRKGGAALSLGRADCLAIGLCQRLSVVDALDFDDETVRRLLDLVLVTGADEDTELRDAYVVIGCVGRIKRLALTGDARVVYKHRNAVSTNGDVPWIGGDEAQHWVTEGPMTQIALVPLYLRVDELFAKLKQKQAVKKTA